MRARSHCHASTHGWKADQPDSDRQGLEANSYLAVHRSRDQSISAETIYLGSNVFRFKTNGAPGLTRCSRTFGATVQYQD